MEPIFWIWATLFTLLFGDFNHFSHKTNVDSGRVYLYMDDYTADEDFSSYLPRTWLWRIVSKKQKGL